MAILDFLKQKKESAKKDLQKKSPVEKKGVGKKAVKSASVKVEKESSELKKGDRIKGRTEKPKVKKARSAFNIAYSALKSPHVTEKATDLIKKNQYIFKVLSDTNKERIKRAVEEVYKVDVLAVKIINVRRKRRKLGKTEGWKQGYKKAIVQIKKGQKIELLPK